MSNHTNQQSVARQIERVLRRSGGLSTLPEIAAELLGLLAEAACDNTRLANVIQTDSALSAKVLSLAAQEGIVFSQGRPTIHEAVARLPRRVLREAILSLKVFPTLNWGSDADSKRPLPRRQLALHSLATACCAEALAQYVLPPEQRPAAYLAGLLHDIGKPALAEIMPKSFDQLIEQARTTGVELSEIEQEHLGLDHASLGKRLAEKWQLPASIVSCIWLHHTDPQTLAASQAEPLLPAVTALADRLARQSAIGQSGSYGRPDDIDEWVAFLKLTSEQIAHVQSELPLSVSRQCEHIQWSPEDGSQAYVAAVQDAAVGLARDNRQLSNRSQRCEALAGQNTLIERILGEISEYSTPVEIAERFAEFWQKQYACGTTAAIVIGEATDVPDAYVDMAVIARDGQSSIATLRAPNETPLVPDTLKKQFCIVPVAEPDRWLLEPIETELNPLQMRAAPLAMQNKVVGILLFEAMQPDETLEQADCATACRIAAFAITMATSIQKHAHLSEQFVRMVGTLRRTRTELAKTQSIQGLAEMAAGAAHELNNPLAVISGRAQLLLTAEEDETKQQMLRQIQQRTEEVAQIVNDLMSYAKPAAPQKRQASLKELIQKAIEKTCTLHQLQSLETDIDLAQNDVVYVDVHQITEALAQIFCNAIEAYPGENGPIRITSNAQDGANAVTLKICDTGCGMDAETLQKALDPFFSFRPAGRRRGMGLSHAQRLLLLNNGAIRLESEPGQGTTVYVQLPKV
ncbi:MAG: HDOD domain-containing protein [Phycisphaerae bacterium]|nr:HDOD domain-containing protein [Phycisphaerae bacterium]